MKTRLLQIIYAKPFTWLDHEDPYTHLIKFYEISCMLGDLEIEESLYLLKSSEAWHSYVDRGGQRLLGFVDKSSED